MRHRLLALAVFATVLPQLPAWAQLAPAFEAADWSVPQTELDARVWAALEAEGLQPAHSCSDAVFLRRAYVDVIGALPDPEETRRFLEDTAADKRARLIEALLGSEEFAHYQTLRWCDLLRVKAEFPVNLWPNAVQAYHRFIYVAMRDNRRHDELVRELLTSSGSNFRVPAVNFYRGLQGREPQAIAEAVALTFMGTRLASWDEGRRADMAGFFSQLRYKTTGEWKEEIVYPGLETTAPFEGTLPDGSQVTVAPEDDPRVAFADWLLAADNPWFAQNAVNRIWSWLMGRGIIHEPDDIRPDNPPSNPELLAYLEGELVASGYDLRHIYRLILNSRTYQQSFIARSDGPRVAALFGAYPLRRHDAEVLADALNWVAGRGEGYVSPIPEPFTYIPAEQRTIALADGSITSSFLEMFGRPPRDTGLQAERNLEPSDAQALYLLNSSDVQRAIQRSPRLRAIVRRAEGDRPRLIRETYLLLLSRYPTAAEEDLAARYWQTPDIGPDAAARDLAWALINSTEFLYRH